MNILELLNSNNTFYEIKLWQRLVKKQMRSFLLKRIILDIANNKKSGNKFIQKNIKFLLFSIFQAD